ncbi:tetratricopeptide repeat protein [Amnibacterium flavum]|uniref:Tetratrico peptide repeat group 5 domain-containing protein n=1 Tax=Amnibacterium flavum TaxID=2173173 RepID=A0A2V1HWX8_9MICO|nr:tetratricopeptide repeat protein [Amnibacterium flavum]PVZ95067.1 hypothetical protein DDQ50_00605 [Amnibacterium flavum]
MSSSDWQTRVDDLWLTLDEQEPERFVAAMQELADEHPGDPVALFELAGANDSTGATDLAVPLYRQALAGGLDSSRHRQASIQLASSLRVLGRFDESVAILTDESARVSDDLDDAVHAFLALALVDADRSREAVALLLTGLAPRLPRYRRSVTAYAAALR